MRIKNRKGRKGRKGKHRKRHDRDDEWLAQNECRLGASAGEAAAMILSAATGEQLLELEAAAKSRRSRLVRLESEVAALEDWARGVGEPPPSASKSVPEAVASLLERLALLQGARPLDQCRSVRCVVERVLRGERPGGHTDCWVPGSFSDQTVYVLAGRDSDTALFYLERRDEESEREKFRSTTSTEYIYRTEGAWRRGEELGAIECDRFIELETFPVGEHSWVEEEDGSRTKIALCLWTEEQHSSSVARTKRQMRGVHSAVLSCAAHGTRVVSSVAVGDETVWTSSAADPRVPGFRMEYVSGLWHCGKLLQCALTDLPTADRCWQAKTWDLKTETVYSRLGNFKRAYSETAYADLMASLSLWATEQQRNAAARAADQLRLAHSVLISVNERVYQVKPSEAEDCLCLITKHCLLSFHGGLWFLKDGCNTTDIIRPQMKGGSNERSDRRKGFDLKWQSSDGTLPVGSHTWQDASFAEATWACNPDEDSLDSEDSEDEASEEETSEGESHGESHKDRVVTITLVTREQHEQTLESIQQLRDSVMSDGVLFIVAGHGSRTFVLPADGDCDACGQDDTQGPANKAQEEEGAAAEEVVETEEEDEKAEEDDPSAVDVYLRSAGGFFLYLTAGQWRCGRTLGGKKHELHYRPDHVGLPFGTHRWSLTGSADKVVVTIMRSGHAHALDHEGTMAWQLSQMWMKPRLPHQSRTIDLQDSSLGKRPWVECTSRLQAARLRLVLGYLHSDRLTATSPLRDLLEGDISGAIAQHFSFATIASETELVGLFPWWKTQRVPTRDGKERVPVPAYLQEEVTLEAGCTINLTATLIIGDEPTWERNGSGYGGDSTARKVLGLLSERSFCLRAESGCAEMPQIVAPAGEPCLVIRGKQLRFQATGLRLLQPPQGSDGTYQYDEDGMATRHVFELNPDDSPVVSASYGAHLSLQGCEVVGNCVYVLEHPDYDRGHSTIAELADCHIADSAAHGIRVASGGFVKMKRGSIARSSGDGLFIDAVGLCWHMVNTARAELVDVAIADCGRNGIRCSNGGLLKMTRGSVSNSGFSMAWPYGAEDGMGCGVCAAPFEQPANEIKGGCVNLRAVRVENSRDTGVFACASGIVHLSDGALACDSGRQDYCTGSNDGEIVGVAGGPQFDRVQGEEGDEAEEGEEEEEEEAEVAPE
jgi:hypothetical protein